MAKEGDNGFGIASVVLGILSVTFSVLIPFQGVFLGVIGLIFALIQRKKSNNKWASWGVILSAVGIMLSIVILYLLLSIYPDLISQLQESGALEGISNA